MSVHLEGLPFQGQTHSNQPRKLMCDTRPEIAGQYLMASRRVCPAQGGLSQSGDVTCLSHPGLVCPGLSRREPGVLHTFPPIALHECCDFCFSGLPSSYIRLVTSPPFFLTDCNAFGDVPSQPYLLKTIPVHLRWASGGSRKLWPEAPIPSV